MKAVIVEDEKLLQKEMMEQLSVYRDIEVVKCIQTVEEGIAWLSENATNVDIIFMDIELADGVCFEIFEAIELTVPVIFLTAYSEYAIQAFKVNSVDYLLKPINSDELKFALNKFKETRNNGANELVDLSFLKEFYAKTEGSGKTRFLVQSGDNYKYIGINEIAYIFSEDKYSVIITFDGYRFIIDHNF